MARACVAGGLLAADYHNGECVVGGNGGVDAAEANFEAFRRGTVHVLCTTTKLERGCDFENVVIVVNFSVPWSLRSFMQQTGRLTGMRTDNGRDGRGPIPTSVMLFSPQEFKHVLAGGEHALHDGVAVLRYGLLKTQCRVTHLAAALGDDVSPDEISCSPGRRCDNCSQRDTKKYNMITMDCSPYLQRCRHILENETDGRLTPKQLVTALQKVYRDIMPSTLSTTTGAMCDLVYRWWDEGYLVGECVRLQYAPNMAPKPEVYVSPSPTLDDQIADNPIINGVLWYKDNVRPDAAQTAQSKQIPSRVLSDFGGLEASLVDTASNADHPVDTLAHLNSSSKKTRLEKKRPSVVRMGGGHTGVSVDSLRELGFQVAEVAGRESNQLSGHRRPGAHPRPVLRALAHASLLGVDTLVAPTTGSSGDTQARSVQQEKLDKRVRLLAKATELVFDAHSAFEMRAFLEEAMTTEGVESLNVKREAYLKLEDRVRRELSVGLPETVVRS